MEISRPEYWSGWPFPSRVSSQPRDRTQASRIAGRFFLSYLGPNPVFLFTLKRGRWLLLTFPQLLSNHRGGWQHLLDLRFREPLFTFGGQKSLMAVTFFCLLIWQDKFSFYTCFLLSIHIKDFGEGQMIEMTILGY